MATEVKTEAKVEKTGLNIPSKIMSLIERKLHLQENHPIEIIKLMVYMCKQFAEFKHFDDFDAKVSTEDNFDMLLIPKDHPCRSLTDTFYFDEKTVLRTHTSAHQNVLLKKGFTKFLVSGPVARKDTIDRTHHPVFHQMEGVCIVDEKQDPEYELKEVLKGIVEELFPGCEYRFGNDYFPFTNPSFEVEVKYEGKWLEILGCGVVQPKILEQCGHTGKKAYAFGLGLERLAMILFKIPDIRYFWSQEDKFLDQFKNGKITQFKNYNKLPKMTKDISFFIPDEMFDDKERKKWREENDFCQLVRDTSDDMVQDLEQFESFFHPTTKMMSFCYHIVYSPKDLSMKDHADLTKVVNAVHQNIRECIEKRLKVVLR